MNFKTVCKCCVCTQLRAYAWECMQTKENALRLLLTFDNKSLQLQLGVKELHIGMSKKKGSNQSCPVMRTDIALLIMHKHYKAHNIDGVIKRRNESETNFAQKINDNRKLKNAFANIPVRRSTIDLIAYVLGINDPTWLMDFSHPLKANPTDYLNVFFEGEPNLVTNQVEAKKKLQELGSQVSATEVKTEICSVEPIVSDDENTKTFSKLPTSKEISDLGKHILNTVWYSCHLTYNHDGRKILVKNKIEITDKGVVSFKHAIGDLNYNGYIKFEETTRFLLVFENQDMSHNERLIYRFKFTPHVPMSKIYGAWLGIDFQRKIRSSAIILFRNKEDSLYNDDERVRKKLSELSDYQICDNKSAGESETARILTEHSYESLTCSSILNCSNTATINLLSIYFPDEEKIFPSIKKRIERLVREVSEQQTKLQVNVFLLNESNEGAYNLRFTLRDKINYKERIEHHILRIADYKNNKAFSRVANFSVYKYSAWPPGHVIQIKNEQGTGDIFYGMLWSRDSAINGPFLHITDESSEMWNMIESDLEAVLSDTIKNNGKVL